VMAVLIMAANIEFGIEWASVFGVKGLGKK
jgi:hypothetical protein